MLCQLPPKTSFVKATKLHSVTRPATTASATSITAWSHGGDAYVTLMDPNNSDTLSLPTPDNLDMRFARKQSIQFLPTRVNPLQDAANLRSA